jgi:hypothetical protein
MPFARTDPSTVLDAPPFDAFTFLPGEARG